MKTANRWMTTGLLALATLAFYTPAHDAAADRGGGHGGHQGGARAQARSSINRPGGGGAGTRANIGANTNRNFNQNVNRNRNINVDRNRNVDRNVDIDRDIDIDVDYHDHDHWNDWDDHPFATAAAITAGVAITSAVIGSIVYSLPPSCVTTVINGIAYRQCGGTWYQPQYYGTTVQYVVVSAP